RHAAQHQAAPRHLAGRSTERQTGDPDAGRADVRRRSRRGDRLPEEAAMMPPLTFDPRRSGIHSRARGNGPEADGTAAERAALEKTWHVPEGILGWFSVVDHRTIGRRYLVTALGFFLVAGLLAGLVGPQVAGPEQPRSR